MARQYDYFKEEMQRIADINHATAVLAWDKEVNIPRGGHHFRSRQMATLSGLAHEAFTASEMGERLTRLSKMKSLNAREQKNVKLALEDYERNKKFTKAFIIEKSMAVSAAFQAWEEARADNDFTLYQEPLDKLLGYVKKEAEILDHPTHPYNALLHQYEPGLTVEQLDPLFDDLKKRLLPLLKKIRKSKTIDNAFLHLHYPKNKQWKFGLNILQSIGYDFDHGRQDISTHPFTISFSPEDVRVTTRIDEHDLGNMTWSCIHEGGHALYEQGLPADDYGLATGSAISLSIHESQSRLWENNVGRSKNFWSYHYTGLQKAFPSNLNKVSINKFYKGINKVSPNFIRTEADELHYHIHVIIRYEIEKAIMENKVSTADLKDLWNEKYKVYLGLDVPDDLHGILQDVHWSHGSIGYFPTYSLGSLYAAQFYAAAQQQIKKLDKKISKGNTKDLLLWLRENIHQHGRTYEADELCMQVTGEKLNTDHFMNYVTKKYADIYKF